MSLIRTTVSDNFEVHYDTCTGMYRVSLFKDYHWQDEIWFDAYEDDGFATGVVAFAEYLKENSFLCDPNDRFSFQAINVEDDLDDLVEDFLKNR